MTRVLIMKAVPVDDDVFVFVAGEADARHVKALFRDAGTEAEIEARGPDQDSPQVVHVKGLTAEKVVHLIDGDERCIWWDPTSKMPNHGPPPAA